MEATKAGRMPVLTKTISLHPFVYFDEDGNSTTYCNSSRRDIEGTENGRYLWNVKRNQVFKCKRGHRALVNVRWVNR